MLKIGIIVYGLDRPLTGISRYTLELVRALGDVDPQPQVTLLVAGSLGPLQGETPFPVIQLRGCRLLPSLLTLGQFVLRRVVQQQQFDLIHDPTGVTPFALCHQVKRVVSVQDVFAWTIPGYSSHLDTLIYKRWLPFMLPRVDHVITASHYSKADIGHYLGVNADKICLIPHGINRIFRPNLTTPPTITAPYILFVGNLTERKNLRRALEAFGEISAEFPTLQFVLVGPRNWKQTPVEQIIIDLGLTTRVHIMGSVRDSELVQLYTHANLFLFPSLCEGFGLPVLEAMACGTPVITSDRSSLPEVAGSAAILVDPYNSSAIAQAIRRVLNSAETATFLRDAGLQHAAHFTWQQTAQQTIDTYSRVYAAS